MKISLNEFHWMDSWVRNYKYRIIGCNISNPATVNDENKFIFSSFCVRFSLEMERRLFGFYVV